ncbi:MAG: hypothetical protein IKU61_07300 [Clostridia bacterium]|nr:hypothetical protein [Clostridia bacterium]
MSEYILNSLSFPLDAGEEEVLSTAAKKLRKAGIPANSLAIYRRSVDARDKRDVKLVYSVRFASGKTLKKETVKKLSLGEVSSGKLDVKYGREIMNARPVVIGMGPCGLFAALLLAENGYRPIVIERGDDVDKRVSAVDGLYKNGMLDTDSNIQFGAGGAGTFSDGKLVTRINDPRCAYVLSALHALGAPKEILINAKPHIGTDILREVVKNAAAKIESLGGEIHYRTKFESFGEIRGGKRVLHTSKGDFISSATVLAIGHSARDTYEMLLSDGFNVEAKDFSVGLRIEHLKSDIDKALYGDFAGHSALPYAEYSLSTNTKVRGVYTFCMCPGGEVVAGASEENALCVNGMSHFARNGRNSNSAVCVSVFKSDYGASARDAIEFQRALERRAFTAGGGSYYAPASTVKDFLDGTVSTSFGKVEPTYMGGKVRFAPLRDLFPKVLGDTLASGLLSFDKKIQGFASPDALLTGVETRTSAPLRILRGEDLNILGKEDVYPAGEGAGYAGGITSAAVDGIKIAEKIMARFKPIE